MKIDNLRKRCCIKSSSSSAEFSISQVESVLVPYLSFEDGFSLCLAAKSLLRIRENIPVVFDGANTSRWDARSIISKLRIFKNAVEIDLQFNRLVATDVLRVLRMIEEGTFPNLRVVRLDWTKSHDSQRKANISIWQILSRLLRGKLDNLVFIDLGSAFIPSGLEGEVMSSLVFRCHQYLDQPDLNPLKRISFDYRSLESRSVTQLARYGIAEATVELGLRYLQGISTSADKTNVERDDKAEICSEGDEAYFLWRCPWRCHWPGSACSFSAEAAKPRSSSLVLERSLSGSCAVPVLDGPPQASGLSSGSRR